MNEFLDFAINHWQISGLFLILLAAYLVFEFWGGLPANSVTPAQAVDLYNHQHAVILDIRSDDAFNKGHIVGSIHLDVNDADSKLKKLHKYMDKPIVVVSTDGKSAKKFADRLKQQKFSQVQILAGGINGWQSNGLPITNK